MTDSFKVSARTFGSGRETVFINELHPTRDEAENHFRQLQQSNSDNIVAAILDSSTDILAVIISIDELCNGVWTNRCTKTVTR